MDRDAGHLAARQVTASPTRPKAVRRGHHARDADGRLMGLAKVENWTKRRAARMGAAVSPFRFAFSPKAPNPHPKRRKPTP